MTSIDGDPARFQRYQDVRDGLLFPASAMRSRKPDGAYDFHARANNVGWRDQEYFANYNRAGKLSLTGSYQQIPQFYSVDTATPYTGSGGTLVLDDAAQRAAQGGAGLSPYPAIAPQFELRERRDIGRVDFAATPTPKLDVTANFTTQKHGGELPLGASFGFSNDVEVPLPYDSRANDFTIGTEWTNTKNMVRVAYSGSWFDNLAPTLVWDSPLKIDDVGGQAGARPHVAVAVQLRADDQLRRLHQAGAQDAGHRLLLLRPVEQQRAAAAVHDQYGAGDDPLPRANTDAEAHVFSTNLNLTSHPSTDWRFGARFRNYTYSNQMPATSITQYNNYDSGVWTTPTGGPDLYAHDRTTFDARRDLERDEPARADRRLHAQRQRLRRADLQVERRGRLPRVGRRRGILDDHLPRAIRGRHRAADRGSTSSSSSTSASTRRCGTTTWPTGRGTASRRRSTSSRRTPGSSACRAGSCTTTSVTPSSGCRSRPGAPSRSPPTTTCRTAWARAAPTISSGIPDCSSRTKGNGPPDPQFNDPLRNWTSDATETVHYFSIYASPPRIGRNTEVRFSYDFSNADASNLYTIPAGSPIPTPNQLPNVFNKLQQLHIDARHRLTSKLAATFSYLYEPLKIYDYAFDPSVVNGIVQPSSLVMGYVYRPYTANSAVFGVQYRW